jgi:hypothetical protein
MLTPEEIRELFLNPSDDYYDHELGVFTADWNRASSIRITLKADNELDAVAWISVVERWDEYTNKMTQLSWQALFKYFNELKEVAGLRHAAFLIDIAERNCIEIPPAATELILAWRSQTRLFSADYALHKTFDRKTYPTTVHKTVLRMLNVGFHKDTFVRV